MKGVTYGPSQPSDELFWHNCKMLFSLQHGNDEFQPSIDEVCLINRVLIVASSEDLVHQCIVPKLMSLLRRSNLLIWCECVKTAHQRTTSGESTHLYSENSYWPDCLFSTSSYRTSKISCSLSCMKDKSELAQPGGSASCSPY